MGQMRSSALYRRLFMLWLLVRCKLVPILHARTEPSFKMRGIGAQQRKPEEPQRVKFSKATRQLRRAGQWQLRKMYGIVKWKRSAKCEYAEYRGGNGEGYSIGQQSQAFFR